MRMCRSMQGEAEEGANLLSVHARNNESTKGTVIKYMPHLIHLFSCVLGKSAMDIMPMKGGIVAAIMMYIRLLATFLVYMPTIRKIIKETTGRWTRQCLNTPSNHQACLPERGISMRRT